MGIKQKFFALAGGIALLVAVISGIGFYTAYSNLESSVENEITATMGEQEKSLTSWLLVKKRLAIAAANFMTSQDGKEVTPDMISMAIDDKEVLALSIGTEDGRIFNYGDGDLTALLDPRTREWYKQSKSTDKPYWTEAYQDAITKKLVVSVAAPYHNKSNAVGGVICEDIALSTLDDVVGNIKYRGEGEGFIIEKTGKILASPNEADVFTDVKDHAALKDHFAEMENSEKGFFTGKIDGEEQVFAFVTVPETGWIIALAVPESFVFSQVNHLKWTYGIISLLSILMVVFVCLKFQSRIVSLIIKLQQRATEMAKGNMRAEALEVDSTDELGTLTQEFNTMNKNIGNLIRSLASTAEQVAASSEELTASAQQSAQASNHVAVTAGDVAAGVTAQLDDVDRANVEVQNVVNDMTTVAGQVEMIADTSEKTATAAQKGQQLMNDAMARMGSIEVSVGNSAEVVKTLGENSQQIGQIVDAIASIADQTNLLALNAAIEAARAGEHGRGFAVVAEEVRKLAAESQSSAEQIKERIASIQADTERAVEAMQSGTVEVQNGTSAINEVGVQFKEIMAMVDDIRTQMEEINGAIQAVTQGAQKIVTAVQSIQSVSADTSQNVQSISAATEEQSASADEIASASQSLANLAMKLQESAGQFRV